MMRKYLGVSTRTVGFFVFAANLFLFLQWSLVNRWRNRNKLALCSILHQKLKAGSRSHGFTSLTDVKSWEELECSRFYRSHELSDSSFRISPPRTPNSSSSPPPSCPQACVGSWQPGDWVQWCPEDERDCGSTFIPSSQDCLYYFYDRWETARCLRDSWVVMLGSSGVTNLGLSWLSSLDPTLSDSFNGPQWYNMSCWTEKGGCSKPLHTVPGFVNFAYMRLDVVFDGGGRVVYKSGDRNLSDAPVVPGGWRLTVIPVQYAHEAVTQLRDAMRCSRDRQASPIVYVQVGQWYLNGFDGKSRAWGLNTSESRTLHALRTTNELFRLYMEDIDWMIRRMKTMRVSAIAIGNMPTSRHACRKREALGCRQGLNRIVEMVVEGHMSGSSARGGGEGREEEEEEEEEVSVFMVDWSSVSIGQQGGAHSSHQAGIMGMQRILSVLCDHEDTRTGRGGEGEGEERAAGGAEERKRAGEPVPGIASRRRSAKQVCGKFSSWSSSCGPSGDWRTMIGRRCDVSLYNITAEDGSSVIREVISGKRSRRTGRLIMSKSTISLKVMKKLSVPTISRRMLELRHGLLLLFALLLVYVLHAGEMEEIDLACLLQLLRSAGRRTKKSQHDSLTSAVPMQSSKQSDADGAASSSSTPGTEAGAGAGRGKGGERLEAISGARLIASLHVVGTHLSRLSSSSSHPYLLQWGYTWVPWFFLLSGYILTFGRVTRRSRADDLDPLQFVWKRLAAVYPLYIFGFAVSLISSLGSHNLLRSFSLSSIIIQMFLLQSWFPSETEHSLQSQCWFLSSIVPFWYMHNTTLKRLLLLDTKRLRLLLSLLFVFPWIFLFVLPFLLRAPLEWYKYHKWGRFENWADVLVVVLKFHPFCYFHMYVTGMILAIVYVRQKQQGSVPWMWRRGSLIGYSLLLVVFCFPAIRPPASKLLCRLGGLAPLQCLILIGLSQEEDAVARFFKTKFMASLGKFSYCIYILQYIVFWLWGGDEADFGFWFLLVVLAAISYHTIQVPCTSDKVFSKIVYIAAASAFALFFAVSVLPDPWKNYLFQRGSLSKQTPFAIIYEQGIVDVRLDLQIPQQDEEDAFWDWENKGLNHKVINPSIAVDPKDSDVLWVAARLHREDKEKHQVQSRRRRKAGSRKVSKAEDVALSVSKWNSRIAVGVLSVSKLTDTHWNTFAPIHPVDIPLPADMNLNSSIWTPCLPPPLRHPVNNSATLRFSTGPEDPRIQFGTSDSQMHITFFSFVPGHRGKTDIPPRCSDPTSYGKFYETIVFAEENRLETKQLSFDGAERQEIEKNWMRFEVKGVVHYIRSLHPYIVVRQSSRKASTQVIVRTEVPAFAQVVQHEKLKIHGGSNAVLVCDGVDSSCYFLAAFHTVDKKGRYLNFAFAFDNERPFSVLALSRQLPLLNNEGQNNFLSGLEVVQAGGNKFVLFTYGCNDDHSRLLKVPLSVVHEWLFPPSHNHYHHFLHQPYPLLTKTLVRSSFRFLDRMIAGNRTRQETKFVF